MPVCNAEIIHYGQGKNNLPYSLKPNNLQPNVDKDITI